MTTSRTPEREVKRLETALRAILNATAQFVDDDPQLRVVYNLAAKALHEPTVRASRSKLPIERHW